MTLSQTAQPLVGDVFLLSAGTDADFQLYEVLRVEGAHMLVVLVEDALERPLKHLDHTEWMPSATLSCRHWCTLLHYPPTEKP